MENLRELEELAGLEEGSAAGGLKLWGLYKGKHMVLLTEEALEALEEMKEVRLPGREEHDPLLSFALVSPPSGAFLLPAWGGVMDDDHFYFAVLLKEKPRTFGEALEKGEVYVSFPGDGC